jgi:hypothetical protein
MVKKAGKAVGVRAVAGVSGRVRFPFWKGDQELRQGVVHELCCSNRPHTMASFQEDTQMQDSTSVVASESSASAASQSQLLVQSPQDIQISISQTEDGKKKKAKRRKVNHACLYCRRSHMTCDEGRPCQRWCVYSVFLPTEGSYL